MSVTLTYNGTTIEIQNPVLDDLLGLDAHDALGHSADGSRRRFGKGDVTRRLALQFEGLRDSERADLQDFFDAVVDGGSSGFTYTDQEGAAWSARFLTTELSFEEIDDEPVAAGTFSAGGVTYPTTTREKAVWAVAFELEVTAA
jgi:hypothetical protein